MSTLGLDPEPDHTEPFSRHRGPVTCAVAIPSGSEGCQRILSSGYDGAVGMSDVESQEMELLGYHEHLVNRLAVSDGGRLAASASSDYTVGLWDLQARRLLRFLRGHSDDVEDFVFVDESTGISVSRDRRVIVWDLQTGAIRKAMVGHDKDVLSVAYADGRIFTSGDDMTLRVWDIESGRLVRCWGPFEHETDTCAIDVERNRVILGCDDGVVRIFEIGTGDAIGEISGHSSGIKIVAVSPQSGHIFSAAYDRRLIVWDADSFVERVVLQPVASAWERSFNWTADGSQIVAGTFDGTVVGWNAADGRQLFEIGDRSGNACFNEVASVGDVVATVADDGYVRLGRLSHTEAAWFARRKPRRGRILANAVAADEVSGVLVAGFHDQTIHIFTFDETLRELQVTDLQEGPINSVRVLSVGDAHEILAACYSGCVVRLSTEGEILAKLKVHDGAVKALRLVPSRDLGISCSADGSVYSWSLSTGERLMAFPGHTAIVNDLDADPAGERVATVGRDFVLNVYSLENGRLLQAFSLGRRSPKAVAFATNDTVMVGDYWGHVISIRLADGTMSRYRIAENGISSLVRRGPDEVVASSYDGRILLVDGETIDIVNDLRAMWQRPLRSAVSAR
jgi:WD40 repeat protein